MARSRRRPLSSLLTTWTLAWVAALVRDVENGFLLAVFTCLLGTLKLLCSLIIELAHKVYLCVRYFLAPQIFVGLNFVLRRWEWGFLLILFLCWSVNSIWVFGCHCCVQKSRHNTLNCVIESNPAFGGRGAGFRRMKYKTQRNENGRKLQRYVKMLENSFKEMSFNATMGYPGEGWSRFTMATWNTRSLTFERLKYCEELGYDVLAITELWRHQNKFCKRNKSFITSEPITIQKGRRKGQVRFPNDKPAGVGILSHQQHDVR